MKKISKIPTIMGVLLLMAGVGAGVLLVNREQIFKLGASPDAAPKDVRITNVSDDSLSISWITDSATTAFIKWGETSTLGKTQQDAITTPASAHIVTLTGLSPGRTYFFKINSKGSDFDNGGVPWTTNTLTTKQNQTTRRISGSVISQAGAPQGGTIVYAGTNELGVFSALTSANGNWTLNMPSSGSDPKTVLLNIYAQGGAAGISTAQVYLSSANPVPPMTLGQTYDFRSQTSETIGNGNLDATISLPEESTESAVSRFDSSTKTTSTQSSTVTIKSISEGETVFTEKPQIFGDGPKNTTISITVHSDQVISDQVKVSSSGTWNWTPPTGLTPGEHTVTLSWRDTSGILRTLTRTFVVEVNAQEPAFESTPSGETPTPTASPKVTPTATPTATLAPTVTPIATPKATVTPVSTSSGLPNAGDRELSLAIMFFGIILLFGGLFVAKKSI